MIHKLTVGGTDILVHSFHFSYSTGELEGMPSQHGSSGRLSVTVEESGADDNSENFSSSRDLLWSRAVDAPGASGAKLKEEITLVVNQEASGQGGRKIKFKGWVTAFDESSQAAGQGVITAEIFVWPQNASGMTVSLEAA